MTFKRSGGIHNYLIEELATIRGREMVQLLQSEFGYSKTLCYSRCHLTLDLERGVDLFFHEEKSHGHDDRAWAIRIKPVIKQFYSL